MVVLQWFKALRMTKTSAILFAYLQEIKRGCEKYFF